MVGRCSVSLNLQRTSVCPSLFNPIKAIIHAFVKRQKIFPRVNNKCILSLVFTSINYIFGSTIKQCRAEKSQSVLSRNPSKITFIFVQRKSRQTIKISSFSVVFFFLPGMNNHQRFSCSFNNLRNFYCVLCFARAVSSQNFQNRKLQHSSELFLEKSPTFIFCLQTVF